MAAEESIILGLGIICALFSYMAFELRSKEEEDGTFGSKISLFLFFVSILFANLLMYALLLISQNSATYLEAPVIGIGLSIMTYGTIGVMIIYALYIIGLFLRAFYDWTMEAMGKRRGDES